MPATAEKKSAPELPKKLPHQFGNAVRQKFERHADAAPADGQPATRRTYRIEVSNDNPFNRYGGTWVLGHQKGEIDLSYAENGLSFWLEHGGPMAPENPDPAMHLGILTNFAIESGALMCDAQFADDAALSPQALAVKRDWESDDPTRRFISVCQLPVEYVYDSETDTTRWVRWQPREASVVGVPAIPGTGRHSATGEEFEVRDVSKHAAEDPDPDGDGDNDDDEEALEEEQHSTTEAVTMSTPATPTAAPEKTGVEVAEALKTREAHINEITELCESYGLERHVERDMIKRGIAPDQARKEILEKLKTDPTRHPTSESLETLGVTGKDLKRYSYARAITLSAERRQKYDGLEGELHGLLEKNMPTDFQQHSGGILVPFETRSRAEIQMAEERRLERFTMGTNAPTKGMELVAQQTMTLVELLQAVPVASQLGAITNFLTGPASYPRVTGGPTVSFKGEDSGVGSTSDLVTGEILSKGRNTFGAVPLTRALLQQTGGQADSYAKRLLVEGEALVVDRAIFGGTGGGEQPLGIYFAPTVQTIAGGSVAPTYDVVTQMLAKVARANAAFGSLGWATTPEIAAKLMKTPVISAAGALPIWNGAITDGQIAGYKAIASSQAPSTLGAGANEHCFAFGNWSSVHINRWGAVEVLVNPYSQALQAITLLHTFGLADCVFTQPAGMCIATAVQNA